MKIYYKKRFYSGLFSLLLGLANPVTCLLRGWERFDWKDGILCVLLILTGLSWILRSLDREKAREDRDEDRDERNHWIELRRKAIGVVTAEAVATKAAPAEEQQDDPDPPAPVTAPCTTVVVTVHECRYEVGIHALVAHH